MTEAGHIPPGDRNRIKVDRKTDMSRFLVCFTTLYNLKPFLTRSEKSCPFA